jgi:hypothetical protein
MQPEDLDEWVEYYLQTWGKAMHTDDLCLGLPDHSTGVGGSGYGGYKNVIEDWQSEADQRSTAIIDMLMGSESKHLDPAEKRSILHLHGCAVFRNWREPVEEVYRRARAKVGEKLRESGFA